MLGFEVSKGCLDLQVQKGLGVSLIFLAWTLSECVRYPWYLSTLLDTPSNRLTWLRYVAFFKGLGPLNLNAFW